jgi:pheromone a factor receptor
MIDLALGLGAPLFTMATHIIYQGHRFDVVQRLGCYPTIYWSWPAIFMYEIWPVILGLVAAGYASKLTSKPRQSSTSRTSTLILILAW